MAQAMQYPRVWESPGPGNSSIPTLIVLIAYWDCGLLGLATIPCVVVESNGEGTFRDENSLEAAQNGEYIYIFSPLFKHQTEHRERKKIGRFLHALLALIT